MALLPTDGSNEFSDISPVSRKDKPSFSVIQRCSSMEVAHNNEYWVTPSYLAIMTPAPNIIPNDHLEPSHRYPNLAMTGMS